MQYEIRKVNNELSHHGIMGQHWGVRRYQYADGSLTPEGRKRYGSFSESISKWKVRQKEKSEARKTKSAEKKEQNKEYLINYGTPKQISKNIKNFNTDDLERIQTRFSTEIKVRDSIDRLTSTSNKIPNASSAGESKKPKHDSVATSIDKGTKYVSDNISKLNTTAIQARSFYNTVAAINNSLRINTSTGTRGLTSGVAGYMTPIS